MTYIQRVNEIFLRVVTVRMDPASSQFNIDTMVHKMVTVPKYTAFKKLA